MIWSKPNDHQMRSLRFSCTHTPPPPSASSQSSSSISSTPGSHWETLDEAASPPAAPPPDPSPTPPTSSPWSEQKRRGLLHLCLRLRGEPGNVRRSRLLLSSGRIGGGGESRRCVCFPFFESVFISCCEFEVEGHHPALVSDTAGVLLPVSAGARGS